MVDQEMVVDEVAQSSAPEGDTPGDSLPSGDAPAADDLLADAPTDART